MKKKILRPATALVIMAHLFLVNCDKNPSESNKTPPVMPPPESMMLDLSAFLPGGEAISKESAPETQQHFGVAAVTAGLVNLSVAVHLAVPVFIFGRALLEDPVLQSDGKFHWTYSPVYQLVQYQADLAGWVEISDAEVNWEMCVTQDRLNLDDYLWYSGQCNIGATQGRWLFSDYRQPNSQIPIIQIQWQIQDSTHCELVFENMLEGNENLGDQLIYQIDGDSARMQFHDVSQAVISKIVWNYKTSAGYIYAPNYNGGLTGYWDENRQDLN
jgi:hypothetical protein